MIILHLKRVNIDVTFKLSPDYAIMTNIDYDHPDYFKNIDDVASAFQEMANNVKKLLLLGEMMNI